MLRFQRIALCLLALFVADYVSAQSAVSTSGTDFWMAFMKNNEASAQESVSLYITSSEFASGTVEIPGQGWSQNFIVNPSNTTTVIVPISIAEVQGSEIVEARGIHISTDQPVSVYALNFEANTSDATKILPTPVLGTNYIVSAYAGTAGHESELLVVATEEDTQVEIIPSCNTVSGNTAGSTITVTLQAGECYQVKASGTNDLTGSIVRSSASSGSCRPFALFSGAACSTIPADCFACDHLYEQNFPVSLWGKEFQVTPWKFELSPDWPVSEPKYTYRILASQNGTVVTIDGVAAYVLNAGQYQEFNHETEAHCVIADHPVSVIQYMEGIACGGNGDPSMLILDDAEKKIDEITFATSESTVITDHYINLIVKASDISSVMFDGNPLTSVAFNSFTSCNDYVWTSIGISQGSHTLTAGGEGVTAYVYGNGPNESYAFSVGSYHQKEIPPFQEIFCTNGSSSIVLSSDYTSPQWFNMNDESVILGTSNTFQPALPIENSIYGVACIDVASSCPDTFYYSVESPDPVSFELFPGNVTICEHQQLQFNVNVNSGETEYEYTWTETGGSNEWNVPNPVISTDHTTTYHVSVSTPGGCSVTEADMTITVNDGGIVLFDAHPVEVGICAGAAANLSVEIESKIWADDFDPQISWGDWEEILGGDADDVCGAVGESGLYFNGVYPRQAVTNPMDVSNGGTVYFSLKVADGTAPCDDAEAGDNVVLAYSVNNGPWTNLQTFNEASYPDFVDVSVTIPVAAYSSSTRFRWRQVGSYMANQDNWVLDNLYVGSNDPDGYDLNWSPVANINDSQSATPVVNPAASTMYYVEMSDPVFGCTYRDSVFVEVGQQFTIEVPDDITVCEVQEISLSAIPSIPGEYSYSWTPQTNISGMYGATPTVTTSATETYHVQVVSESGCFASGDVVITVGALLDFVITTPDSTICEGDNTTLSANISIDPSDISFEWIPAIGLSGTTTEAVIASPTASTTYGCTITHVESGCVATDQIVIDVTPEFMVEVVPPEVSACIVAGTEVNATTDFSGALTWSWEPAAMVMDAATASTTLSGNGTGTLTITGTSQSGCEASAEIIVTQQDEVTNLGDDTGLCEGDQMTLDTGWPDTYTINWSNGQSTSSIVITESGTYSVEVTSPEGCHSEDEIVITGYSYPVVLLGSDTAVCSGDQFTLHGGNGGLNYEWNTGATTADLVVLQTGTYSVEVSNSFCSSSDEIIVVVNPLPVVPFEEEIIHCFDFEPELVLDAKNDGSTYLWSDGTEEQKITLKESGDYFVMVTSEDQCQSVFDVTVISDCPSYLFIPNAFTPDGDGINDVWKPEGYNLNKYHLFIYDRWGAIVFETQDIDKPWIGQKKDGEYYVEAGAYSYVILYNTIQDNGMVSEDIRMKGSVTVVR